MVYDPVQEATIEANGDKWSNQADTYVCNGPFKITEMNMGENVILEKNENYWDAEMSLFRRSITVISWIPPQH